MKPKYKTLAELYAAVKSGKIDESKMEIWVDNDGTGIYLNDEHIHEDHRHLCEGHGYDDVTVLYDLLFPKAMVSPV